MLARPHSFNDNLQEKARVLEAQRSQLQTQVVGSFVSIVRQLNEPTAQGPLSLPLIYTSIQSDIQSLEVNKRNLVALLAHIRNLTL